MRLALIPPGEFEMGSSQEEVARLLEEAKQKDVPRWYIERTPAEAPKHPVKITRPFYLGICEVTQEQYQRLMGSNPSKFSGVPVRPVEQVTWTDAAEFCRRLNEAPQEKSAGAVYRLPTESEWEYACRAGTTTCYSFGDDFAGHVRDVWWQGSQTQFVGQLRPNAWGLLDMHGNVWEWCQDCYDERYYQQLVGNIANDPQGPSSGSFRLFRGGGWGDWAGICRSAFRNRAPPDFQNSGIGFRVVRIVAP
jgi:formylglycine-generating enzyme required for sulfatase activity